MIVHSHLCQEYLRGKEYVVDHVSLNGIHKTVMTWVYDKRPANGSSFVYYGDIPIESNSKEAKVLIPYARAVLDALGVQHGPSHGEFILTDDGPCLVEMNCRCHGGDGIWESLCQGLTGGYNQVDATVSCYLDEPQVFQQKYPDRPHPFQTKGQCVDLVSYSKGIVIDTPGYRRMKLLPSFIHLESNIRCGSNVSKTVDLITDAGCVVLMHHDEHVLEQDIQIIRALETSNALFEYESKSSSSSSSSLLSLSLERKLSVPKEEDVPVANVLDAMPPSMYLERKLSAPKEQAEIFVGN